MLTQFASSLLVCCLVTASVSLAALPSVAAWRSGNSVPAAKLAVLTLLPLLSGAILLFLTAKSDFSPAVGVSAAAALGILVVCSLVVYRRTPEVDRLDRLVLALMGSLLFSPLAILFLALSGLLGSLGTTQVLMALAMLVACLGLPAAVIAGYGVVLDRVRQPAPVQVRRMEINQRRLADAAAKQLLRDVMGDDTTRRASTRGYLEVEGKYCRYRVYPGSFRTAVLNKNGRWIGNLCVVPANSQPVPDYDQLLAKVLMLQHAEEEFWATANLIDSGPEAWDIRDKLTGQVPVSRRARVEPEMCR